jgi:cyclic beta-1,2-glucan synthetase
MEAVEPVSTTGPVGLDEPARELARSQIPAHRRPHYAGLRRHVRSLSRELDGLFAALRADAPAHNTASAEWFLDNYYVISEARTLVRQDLSRGFVRKLVTLEGAAAGYETRVGLIAAELVAEGEGRVDPERAARFLDAYQSVAPLSTAELWAFPALLRLSLIEELVDCGKQLLSGISEEKQGPGQTRIVSPAGASATLDERVAGAVGSLRTAATLDWKSFVESVSRVERTLRSLDPAGAYARMDFHTRDRYRKAVEVLASRSGESEAQVALRSVDLAREAGVDGHERPGEPGEADVAPRHHVGFYLHDEGRLLLESRLGSSPTLRRRAVRWLRRHRMGLYLGAVAVLTLLAWLAIVGPLVRTGAGGAFALWTALIAFVPSTTVAVSVFNWVAGQLVKPRVLPKMDLPEGLPASLSAAVVVPCLLTDRAEIPAVARQLELNYGGNRDPGLRFVLLTDHVDAPRQVMPEDDGLLECAAEAVGELNRRYRAEGDGPFMLLHRNREWNPAQGCWMGWERKRGKLTEFNRLALGLDSTSFSCPVGDMDELDGVQYVITLDSDTFLPQGAARRLLGTFLHPLNTPHLDSSGRLIRGYTVLQPRVETLPGGGAPTRFSKVYEADRGLDLYSHAVSDVYQDLFRTGIYAGKGIYHVEAFHRSLEGRVPDNALLSHDLFEGVHGRAALVTDVAVFEDFPTSVLPFMRRLHRWVRGDWQLAPWLLPSVPAEDGGRIRNVVGPLGRWQIADNLRRSLLMSSLVLLLLGSWLSPATWWWWGTIATGVVLGAPVFLGAAASAARGRFIRRGSVLSRSAPLGFFRWCLALAFLPYQAAVELDAIVRTLYRLGVSRTHLLEWTSSAATSRALGTQLGLPAFVKGLAPGPVTAVGLGVLVVLLAPSRLPASAPILAAWLISPILAMWISRPIEERRSPASPEDTHAQRRLARRTWAYFERFLAPDHHWLPPDNFQEYPGGQVAARTSPTNIGLGLLSTLSAYDLGYLTSSDLVATVSNTLDGLDELELHRGHLLNWYDTRTLEPLAPRYVSTVDSGNLAASLIALGAGIAAHVDDPFPRARESEGLLDTLRVLLDTAARVPIVDGSDEVAITTVIEGVIRRVEGSKGQPRDAAYEAGVAVDEIERCLEGLMQADPGPRDGGVLREVQEWLRHLDGQAARTLAEIDEMAPWVGEWKRGEQSPTAEDANPARGEVWRMLRRVMPPELPLAQVPVVCGEAIEALQLGALDLKEVRGVEARLRRAAEAAGRRVRESGELRARCVTTAHAMDFSFLYDASRKLFHIGYNVTMGELDNSYYDLLASEARLASFVAIAKGDVPSEHWLHLGRPFGRADGRTVLLSWAGTMFEYLMPGILMRMPEHSLLAVSCRGAVARQSQFARAKRVPWGISESGCHELDDHGVYQYRAFGVPALGLHRDLGDRLVISPYASALAWPLDPSSVAKNVEHLDRLGGRGPYGLYEAIDFGRPGGGATAQVPSVVRSYMAHHQGMILVTLNNLLNDDIMVDRFHADPRMAAPEFLLHERAPGHVQIEPSAPPAPAAAPRVLGPPAIESWAVRPDEGLPQALALSNGRLSALVTATGAGGLRWGVHAITRWHADMTADPWGHWLYIQDVASDTLWSPYRAPMGTHGDLEVRFAPHEAEFHAMHGGVSARVAVTVAPGADVEIRRLTLINDRPVPRLLHVTNYAEVSLARPEEDRRHPAFVKLFVESEFRPEVEALVFRRRPASPDDPPLFLAHTVAYRPGAGEIVAWETDRERFLGRNGEPHAPAALRLRQKAGPGASGCVLDPILSFTFQVELPARGDIELVYLTAVGESKEAALAAIDVYRTQAGTSWAFQRAGARSQRLLHSLDILPAKVPGHQRLLSALLHPYHALRGRPSRFPDRMPQQQGLWALGISGDLPLLAVRVSSPDETAVLLDALKAYALWREQNVAIEMAVLDDSTDGYRQPLAEWLRRALTRLGRAGDLNRPRGVHYLPVARLDPLHRATIEEAARVMLDAERGDLLTQLAGMEELGLELPPFVPVPTGGWAPEPTKPLPPSQALHLHNGLGGFTTDGREYHIRLDSGTSTPAPWINVVATPDLGFIVSEAGSGFSWVGNSGESRLTTWANDPVIDRSGELIFVRDEETADYWTPTPRPRPGEGDYEVRHGAGYSVFIHHGRGLRHRLKLFAALRPRAKVIELELENEWSRHRRLTVTYFAEWVLGADRQGSAPHLETGFDAENEILVAKDLFSELEEAGVAFLASDQPAHGWTTDRREFLGRGRSPGAPAALERIGLDRKAGLGIEPCAALQVHVSLAPGETRTVRFFLGWEEALTEVKEVVQMCRAPGAVQQMEGEARGSWDGLLSRVTVRTPDPAMDVLLNRWLLYQALSCRLWGRSALYQSSGAFGFRDQLQDSLAFLLVEPGVARGQILESAGRQFEEGDVLHWWHPPSGRGVRTRCSDDLLWLPYVTAAYFSATGDRALLAESVPYLAGAPLADGERERYGNYLHGEVHGSVYEHCVRAIDRASTKGGHGLPLIGTGDWNDALDRVGEKGEGESVWLAWFLYATLESFASVAEELGDEPTARRFRHRAAELQRSIEDFAWDGGWYLRATYDDGTPIGAAGSDEAKIDAISQAWAVLSGGASRARAEKAMDAVWDELVREDDGLIRLLSPPFDRTERWPGYIKAYPPGVRENGGQYTHAAIWTALAYAALGDGDRAGRCFELLNPVHKSQDWRGAQRYRVEPYVVAADVYSVPPHVGRGGWTWYTGSASWMWRLGTEAILGLKPVEGGFMIEPCIPSSWPTYEIVLRARGSTYRIEVDNPDRVCSGVQRIELDGVVLPSNRITVGDDERDHEVKVRLGTEGGRRA